MGYYDVSSRVGASTERTALLELTHTMSERLTFAKAQSENLGMLLLFFTSFVALCFLLNLLLTWRASWQEGASQPK